MQVDKKKLEIEKLVEQELQAAKSPVFEKIKDDPDKIIADIHKAAIINQVQTDEATNKKFIEQAKKTVDNELGSINQENIAKRQKATYNANLEACRCYGVEAAVPLWQIYLMRAGHAVWFVIYFLFASVTICPINVFVTGINAFIKRTWLSIVIAVLIYVSVVVLVPILTTYLKKGG